jgi:hypothetical protein
MNGPREGEEMLHRYIFFQSPACSKAKAALQIAGSSKCLPTSISDTGSPLDMPQGRQTPNGAS